MADSHCPILEARDWDRRFWDWKDKPFYAATYWSIMHIPLNLDAVVRKAVADIRERNLMSEPIITFTREETMFHSTILISIREGTDELPVETLTGRYYSRLFEGGYGDTGKHMGEMRADLGKQGLKPGELLLYHATCPVCVEERGAAQTVVFARVC